MCEAKSHLDTSPNPKTQVLQNLGPRQKLTTAPDKLKVPDTFIQPDVWEVLKLFLFWVMTLCVAKRVLGETSGRGRTYQDIMPCIFSASLRLFIPLQTNLAAHFIEDGHICQ